MKATKSDTCCFKLNNSLLAVGALAFMVIVPNLLSLQPSWLQLIAVYNLQLDCHTGIVYCLFKVFEYPIEQSIS